MLLFSLYHMEQHLRSEASKQNIETCLLWFCREGSYFVEKAMHLPAIYRLSFPEANANP